MDRSKMISVVFLAIILGIGFVAYKFYSDNQILLDESVVLKEENQRLTKENKTVLERYGKMEREKQSLEDKWNKVDQEISRLGEDSESWQKKYNDVLKERDALAKEIKELAVAKESLSAYESGRPRQVYTEASQEEEIFSPPVSTVPSVDKSVSEDYWVDFVQEKAALEAQLGELKKELSLTNQELVRLQTINKDISRKAERLQREKELLERDLSFTKRTMDIMSRDLVNERETRRFDSDEVVTLRAENSDLRKNLSLLEKQNLDLETVHRAALEEKKLLESKVSGVENLLKEKALVFEELKEGLNQAVKDPTYKSSAPVSSITGASINKPLAPCQFAAVELPPIVVTPRRADSSRSLHGQILAVNWEEKFVVLDLGESAGITPGVRLKVMHRNKEMATVEVIETRKEISAADIIEVAGGGVIREGFTVVGK